jgi:hypothetical protein
MATVLLFPLAILHNGRAPVEVTFDIAKREQCQQRERDRDRECARRRCEDEIRDDGISPPAM